MQRRFRQEQQILGQLQHPGIAQLLDLGATPKGVPYLVMEHIDGQPIVTFADQQKLGVDERIQLVRQVCEAVAFAHRQLVVHRDIKPRNILVTAGGHAKLLDFGIAKILEPTHHLAGQDATRTDVRLLTPNYASPEQLLGQPVSTATDVFGLGILLFELLTGERPFDWGETPLVEVERAMKTVDPPRGSSVVGALLSDPERITEVAGQRSLTPRRLQRRLSGDLDNILGRALALDPEARYASVDQLAADLGRHLEGLPITAHAPRWSYIATKFVRRNAIAVVATVSITVGLAGFGVLQTVQSQRLATERDIAAQERDAADLERDKARETKDFMVELFSVADPGEARGNSITAREMLDRGAERITEELVDQPEVQAELMSTMGTVYQNLGLYEPAGPLLERALELRRATFGNSSLEVAASLGSLGTLLFYTGDYAEGEPLAREALNIYRALYPGDHTDIADTLEVLGVLLRFMGEPEEAEQMARETLDMRRELLGNENFDIGDSINNLAGLLKNRGEYDQAVELYLEAVALYRKTQGDQHPSVARGLSNLGLVLVLKGDREAAEPVLLEALELRRTLFGKEHPSVADTLSNLGGLWSGAQDHAKAAAYFREALLMQQKLLGDHPYVGRSHLNLGSALVHLGELATAEVHYKAAQAIFLEQLGEEHWLVGQGLRYQARLRLEQENHDQAVELSRRSVAILEKQLGLEDPRTMSSVNLLGASLVGQLKFEEAEPLLLQSYEWFIKRSDSNPIEIARQRLVDLYTGLGQPKKAEPYRRPQDPVATSE